MHPRHTQDGHVERSGRIANDRTGGRHFLKPFSDDFHAHEVAIEDQRTVTIAYMDPHVAGLVGAAGLWNCVRIAVAAVKVSRGLRGTLSDSRQGKRRTAHSSSEVDGPTMADAIVSSSGPRDSNSSWSRSQKKCSALSRSLTCRPMWRKNRGSVVGIQYLR